MALTDRRLTAAEYLALDLPRNHQLIDGEVVVNEPAARHQRILGWVYRRLCAWCEAAPGRGEAFLPLDVVLGDDDVFAPDVLWLDEERRPGRDDLRLHAAPDLAVEVRSPSTWRYDVGAKKATYERHGLAELWLVDTAADVVLVFRRSVPTSAGFDVALEVGRGEVLTSPLLVDLSIDVGALFDR